MKTKLLFYSYHTRLDIDHYFEIRLHCTAVASYSIRQYSNAYYKFKFAPVYITTTNQWSTVLQTYSVYPSAVK